MTEKNTPPVSRNTPPAQPQVVYTGKNNDMAVASLVLSLCGLFVLPFFGSILGLIFGFIAQNQIKQRGEQGKGMATAGIIIGLVPLVLGTLAIIFWVFMLLVVGIFTLGAQ